MAAPNLALRNVLFVNYVGTDDPGYDAIGKPWSYRSIAAALASLAVQSNPPSATNPWTIAVGPGVFVEPGITLPNWVWITGTADGETGENTTVQLTGNIELDSSWGTGSARGGFANMIIRPAAGHAPVIDLTMPSVAGTPGRTVDFEDIITNVHVLNFEGIVAGDSFNAKRSVQDGTTGDLVSLFNGNLILNNFKSAAPVSIGDSGLAVAATLYGVYLGTGAGMTINSVAHAVAVTIAGSRLNSLALNQTGGSLAVSADAISLPIKANITTAGAPTIARLTDAFGVGYTPTTPGNWPVVPATVQAALDDLAAGGTGGSTIQRGNVSLANGVQSYPVVFTTPFATPPTFLTAQVQMPNNNGEVFAVSPDLSTLTDSGVTFWLSGIPSAASFGGELNWGASQ